MKWVGAERFPKNGKERWVRVIIELLEKKKKIDGEITSNRLFLDDGERGKRKNGSDFFGYSIK